jgi:hypothetical protein
MRFAFAEALRTTNVSMNAMPLSTRTVASDDAISIFSIVPFSAVFSVPVPLMTESPTKSTVYGPVRFVRGAFSFSMRLRKFSAVTLPDPCAP